MFFLANRMKNQMQKQRSGGGVTDDGAHDQPQEQQTNSQPATYGTDSRYSIGSMMSRIGGAQGKPTPGAQPVQNQPDVHALVRQAMASEAPSGAATQGAASTGMSSDLLERIRARMNPQGY